MSRELSLALAPICLAVLVALAARADETREFYAGQPARVLSIVGTTVLLFAGAIFGAAMAGGEGDAPVWLVFAQMFGSALGLVYLAVPLVTPLLLDVERPCTRARGRRSGSP